MVHVTKLSKIILLHRVEEKYHERYMLSRFGSPPSFETSTYICTSFTKMVVPLHNYGVLSTVTTKLQNSKHYFSKVIHTN